MDTLYISPTSSPPFCIRFSYVPPPSFAGFQQVLPFTIAITACDTAPHVVNLYSQYSQSIPERNDLNGKWSHLIPRWRFLDTEGNIIQSLTTIDTPIMSGDVAIGATGYGQFYYIDDFPTSPENPVVLWASLNIENVPLLYGDDQNGKYLPSYANSKVIACLPYNILSLEPSQLCITTNGIISMSASPHWIDHRIPYVISVCGTASAYNYDGEVVNYRGMMYDYPSSNALGHDMGQIERSITTLPDLSNYQIFQPLCADNTYLSATGDYSIGGYIHDSVVASEIALNTTISAGVQIQYNIHRSHPNNIWYADPMNKRLCNPTYTSLKTDLLTGLQDIVSIYPNFLLNQFTSPILDQRFDVMMVTGMGGIYSFALDKNGDFWCTDVENDAIYKISQYGKRLKTIPLSGFAQGGTPSEVALDSQENLWVTLFDSSSVLKIDSVTLSTIAVINPTGNEDPHSPNASFGYDPDIKPSSIDTDKDDNIWVAYNNTLHSGLCKYDTTGELLNSITLPLCSNPMSVFVDGANNVLVALPFHSGPEYFKGEIRKYDTNGNIVFSCTAVHPEYITVDLSGDIWFTEGQRILNRLKSDGTFITSLSFGASSYFGFDEVLQPSHFEGLATDSYNRIWLLDSINNNIYVINDDIIDTFPVNYEHTTYYLDDTLNDVVTSSPYQKTMHAYGDWTGVRWLTKYGDTISNTVSMYLTGESDVFDIDDYHGYDIRRFNESWDIVKAMRAYAIPYHVQNNDELFNSYLSATVGGLETLDDGVGRRSYERIANFVKNHADIDTCTMKALYSIAHMLDVPIDDYQLAAPKDIQRLLDILSIPHDKLWGSRCTCSSNFKRDDYGYCTECGHMHPSNRGDVLCDCYIVSSGVPYLAEYKFHRNYFEKITPYTLSDGTSSFNLFNHASAFLINPPEYYCFYEYISTVCNVQTNGIINWDDEYTTIQESESGLNTWYAEGQIVEKMFNFLLYNKCGFEATL